MLILALATAVIAAMRGLWSPCGLSMLSSLNPVSEHARGNRFWLTACWYVAGAVGGGALLGVAAALGARGVAATGASRSVLLAVGAAAAVVCLASDLRVVGRSLPLRPRQVDERWLATYRRWIYASGYGAQIGTGFATYIMSAAVYLTAALAVLTASWRSALLVGLVFGAVRGLTIVTSALTRTPEALRALHRRLAAHERTSFAAALVVQAVVAVAAAPVAGGAGLAVLGVLGSARYLARTRRRRRARVVVPSVVVPSG